MGIISAKMTEVLATLVQLISAESMHVDHNLVAAVILTESAGKADVKSAAGAIGLMQVLPSTARGLAKELGIADFKDSMLYDPAINVKLGSYLLSKLEKQYEGDLDLVLASYHGGHKAARNVKQGKLTGKYNANYIIKVKRMLAELRK